MRKKIFMLLLGIMFFSLVGCGNNEDKNKNDVTTNKEDGGFKIVETTEKREPKYHSKYFSATALMDIVSQFNYDEDKLNKFKELYEAINGRIVDTFYYNDSIYFLTSSGMYYTHRLLFFSSAISVDIKDNTKIEMIGNNFIVLTNDAGEYSIYLEDHNINNKYVECTPEGFSVSDDEFAVLSTSSTLWDYLSVISNVDKNGITAKNYTILNIYEENEEFGLESEKKYEFSEEFNSEVSQYVVSSNKSVSSGFVLLENGDMYYIEPYFAQIYKDQHVRVRSAAINNVEKIYNTNKSNEVYIQKVGEIDCIYKYKIDIFASTDKIEPEVVKIKLPSEFTVNDIDMFLAYYGDSYFMHSFIKLKNGEVYSFRDDTGEFQKESVLTETLKKGSLIGYADIEGLHCFVMDDGNIYTYVDDKHIERYGLK